MALDKAPKFVKASAAVDALVPPLAIGSLPEIAAA